MLESQARFRLGQWDDAEQRLSAVKAAAGRADDYRDAQAINNLGMSRLIRNRFDEALPQFETSVVVPGSRADAHLRDGVDQRGRLPRETRTIR